MSERERVALFVCAMCAGNLVYWVIGQQSGAVMMERSYFEIAAVVLYSWVNRP